MENIIQKVCAGICLAGVACALTGMGLFVIPALGAIVAVHEVSTYAG